jgi:hypothetical protein
MINLHQVQGYMAAAKPKPCKQCGSSFTPSIYRLGASVCSPMCAKKWVTANKKAEKTQDRAKRESLKTIPKLIKEAQIEFNAYVRYRDRAQPCICCGLPLGTGEVGGAYDCGHYRSTGSAAHLRFDERNAHAQRKACNRWGAGRAVDYRVGLIGRIGLEAVEALESNNEVIKWDRDTLRQIKTIYRAKLRELKKEQE